MRNSSRNTAKGNGLLSRLSQLNFAIEKMGFLKRGLQWTASRSRRLLQWIPIGRASTQRLASIRAAHREEIMQMSSPRATHSHCHARCACGWKSPNLHEDGWETCRAEYRAHVIESVGKSMAYYTALVVCTNCSYRGKAEAVVGQKIEYGICPSCNVRNRLESQEYEAPQSPLLVR
jgi:hypothetical protein